jgi:hypothetical protein
VNTRRGICRGVVVSVGVLLSLGCFLGLALPFSEYAAAGDLSDVSEPAMQLWHDRTRTIDVNCTWGETIGKGSFSVAWYWRGKCTTSECRLRTA